jgi:hypothetical protein
LISRLKSTAKADGIAAKIAIDADINHGKRIRVAKSMPSMTSKDDGAAGQNDEKPDS